MKKKVNIFWFRRDLRLEDNAGLFQALKSDFPVLPLFIFDINILEKLTSKDDARVTFIHSILVELNSQIQKNKSSLRVEHGTPKEVFKMLKNEFDIQQVFANRDYEPYTIQRDKEIDELLKSNDIEFNLFKDQLIFEHNEVIKDDGTAYTVFTPYSKKWKLKIQNEKLYGFETNKYFDHFLKTKTCEVLSLEKIGFNKSNIKIPEFNISEELLQNYGTRRDLPALNATSKLGIYLRFGTVSIREVTKKALAHSETFLNELIWRNFFTDILWHFPHVVEKAFKPKYDFIQWRNNEREFELWCKGETGYPLVDAGMRELNATGFMHNRVRMVTASFLIKHLLIDWRWGEAYFAEKLLDFELASNNGNWQWAAGSGCDAAPYFRVFNPETQMKKFDKDLKYVLKWVPEYGTVKYITPIVDHKFARERVLQAYKKALT